MKTAIVLASGPSLTAEQIDAARRSGHFTMVVNTTYQKFLDASALYGGDFLWWKTYMPDVVRSFKGKLWTQDNSVAARWPKVKHVRGTNREGLGRDIIHQLGNSGFQAINLAYLWGFQRIVLLGMDMKLGPDGERHHHPDHPAPCVQSQTFDEWRYKSVKLARDLKEAGCVVVNCTPGTALTTFPCANWEDVLC